MWFSTGAYETSIYPGPHYVNDQKKIGRKITHTLEELLKMDVEDSIKKKLKNAKPGHSVFINNLYASGDLYVKRLREEEIEAVKKFREINNEVSKYFKKTKSLQQKKQDIQSSLLKGIRR